MKKMALLVLLSLMLIQCQSDSNKEALPTAKTTVINTDKFDTVPSEVNYVMAIPVGDDLHTLKSELQEYNTKNGFNDLRIGHMFLEDDKENVVPIIIYRRFKNMESAKNYCDVLKQYNSGKAFTNVYPISQFNYRRVLKNKNIESYLAFYEKNIAVN